MENEKENEKDMSELIAKKTAAEVIKILRIKERKKDLFDKPKAVKTNKLYLRRTEEFLNSYYELNKLLEGNLNNITINFDKDITNSHKDTRDFCNYINKLVKMYIEKLEKTKSNVAKQKKRIVAEIYIKGISDQKFLEKYSQDYKHHSETNRRTLRRYKNEIVKDLAPYFFGVNGLL